MSLTDQKTDPTTEIRRERPASASLDRRSASDATTDRTASAATQERTPALGLSLPSIMAGALASVTAAVLGSRLGVAGTLIGAAVKK